MFDTHKTRMIGLPCVKLWHYIKPFRYNTRTWRTDRRTDRRTYRIAMSVSRDKNRSVCARRYEWCTFHARCHYFIDLTVIFTLYEHIKTAEQRTITQQYGDCYTGRWWVGCYIWYSEEGPGRAAAPPSPLLGVPNVTAHPSTASVPNSYYLMWHYNCL